MSHSIRLEFPSRQKVELRASYIACWVEVWVHKIYIFFLNIHWIIVSESRNYGYFIKLLLARDEFLKRASWICDGKIQVWQKELDSECLVMGNFVWLLIHLCDQYLLSICNVLGSLLGSGDIARNKANKVMALR